MKIKIKLILNILLHYKRYRKIVGHKVRILKNNGLAYYDKFIGTEGYVLDFEFYRFDKPIIVKLNDKTEKCFSFSEIERI